MRPRICKQLRPRVVGKFSTDTTSRSSLGVYSEKIQVFLSSGQSVCCGLVKQILRKNAEKSEAENLNGYTFFRNLCDEHLEQVLVRDRLLNVISAGRNTTACLWSWTSSVKNYIHAARPASEPLVQRIVRINLSRC